MTLNAEQFPSEDCDRTWECIPTTSHYVDKIAFSPDGKILASYNEKSTEFINLWDVASCQKLYAANFRELVDMAGGWERIDFRGCRSLFFTPDGKSLTGCGFIWNLELGEVINVLTLNSPFKVSHNRVIAVSPDLQIAVAASDVGTMKLWETSTGKEIHTLFLGCNVDKLEIYKNLFRELHRMIDPMIRER
ncbi:hypothetical protein VB735_34275 [Halotia wernerae UHCC 0503]|nr:hypothetical protein [Halotia wernerae UHCC 0503]